MVLLGLDVGSSSVKAAILRHGRVAGPIARESYPTKFDAVRAEIRPRQLLAAVARAIGRLGPAARRVDAIALSTLSPSWVAMDGRGRPITPIITHQDRRSVHEARDLLAAAGGQQAMLRLAGNLPFPGGISSTTLMWFLRHEKALMRRAELVGHLSTLLIRQMTGARVTDPSHASFMGLYRTLEQAGWSEDLCGLVGVSPKLLPDILESDRIAGHVTGSAARRFGLAAGTPMLAGMVDTGAAMLLTGAKPGQLLNVSGSTDVLALCTDCPRPHPQLLTRALGVGRKWLSVSTLAAAGSTLDWVHRQMFADLPEAAFRRLLGRLARRPLPSTVRFDAYLAGDRMSIEQKQGAFAGLTLATTRLHMLSAVIESLAAASARRLPLLACNPASISRRVVVSGGVQTVLSAILHRDWPGKWEFRYQAEATLRGLARLAPARS